MQHRCFGGKAFHSIIRFALRRFTNARGLGLNPQSARHQSAAVVIRDSAIYYTGYCDASALEQVVYGFNLTS
jgi:hypothetical protein